VETRDDDLLEEPEKLSMTSGTPVNHFLEFNPDSTIIWIIDDDSLLLPVPDVSAMACVSEIQQTTLTVSCTPADGAAQVAELLCSVDGERLKDCSSLSGRRKRRAAEPQVVTLDLLEYDDGAHVLEIVGLTQVTQLLRGTVQFYGLAQPFNLDCVDEITETGLIDVTCTTERVLETLTCTIDEGAPMSCSLNFVLDPDDYDEGPHTVVVSGTNLLGETKEYTFTFESAEPVAVSVWDDREFVAAIAIAGVAFVILLLLMLAICLLIFYHRKVNKLNKYGLDLRSENEYVGIERNLSYRDHELVELVDYSRQPPSARAPERSGGARPASRQSEASSSAARPSSQQPRDPPRRPGSTHSEASTALVTAQEPASPTSATFHLPPPPPAPQPTAASVAPRPAVVVVQSEPSHVTLEDTPSMDDVADSQTEEQLLLAASGVGEEGMGESRGLKISRRHSVETGKESRKTKSRAAADETDGGRTASFSAGRRMTTGGAAAGGKQSEGAYSVTYAKELRSKEWEAALQKEFDEEIAREKESVRARERRREVEQRERRRQREQMSRDQRAQARRDRERERDAAKERRLAQSPSQGSTSPDVIESPESFL
jgi:hypothetical protein